MKKILVCLSLAAVTMTFSVQAGEAAKDKAACAAKSGSSCCASKSACAEKAAKKAALSLKGAESLAKR